MSDLGSIAIEGLSLLAAVASLAVTAVLLRVVLGSYIISMDEPAFRNFSRSGHMMLVAMVLFGIAMLARPVDYFTYDFLELLAILLFLAAVLIFVNYFKKGGSGERLLTRLDWGELEKEVKLKEVERDLKEDVAFRRFLPAAKGMHFVLVEVGQGVAPFPVLEYFYSRLVSGISSSSNVCVALGPTTPHEFRRHSGQMGYKCNLWVSSAEMREEWMSDKFTVVTPADLTDMVHYFKSVSGTAGGNVAFVGDFIDELSGELGEKELHAMVSDVHAIMEANGNLLVLIATTGLYTKGKLAILERYADGIAHVEGKPPAMSFLDTHTNETAALGEIPLGRAMR